MPSIVSAVSDETSPTSPPVAPSTSGSAPLSETNRRRIWRRTLLICAVVLAGLGWLLAMLIWLWYYSGLIAFLVAGLLVGGMGFRLARAARPIAKRRILIGSTIVAFVGWVAALCFEFRHVAATIGGHPTFPDVREKALSAGRTGADVTRDADAAFRQALAASYPPGGPLGYVQWAVHSGELVVSLDGSTETVTIAHRRSAWTIRTILALLLLILGQWCAFESLRSPVVTSNILPPGAAYERGD